MPYSVKGFFEIDEDMVQILLVLEVLFTQDSEMHWIVYNDQEFKCQKADENFTSNNFVLRIQRLELFTSCLNWVYPVCKYNYFHTSSKC